MGQANRARRQALLRDLGELAMRGDKAVRRHLEQLSPEARFELVHGVVPELSVYLSALLSTLPKADIRRPPCAVIIPEDLPPGLAMSLRDFQRRLEARYRSKVEKGHVLSHAYVLREMQTQLRFAKHLAARHVERWDIVRKRDVVRFLDENPAIRPNSVMRFMRFLNEHQPFRETRGRPTRSRGGERRHVVPPKIVSPEVLEALLADIRATRTDPEYLLAWLVCRMGMTANAAYLLPLDRVRTNDAGRLVIRPAQVWVSVPRTIEPLFRSAIQDAWPNWTERRPSELKHLTFFQHHITRLNDYTADVLQGRTRILRASAVFAAMMQGHLDRVTLHQTMGASMVFIAKLELLLSADMHRRLAPDLVAKRNAHILGTAND